MHYKLQAIVEGQGGSIQLCCAFGNQQTFAKAKLASQLTAAEFEVIAVPVRKYAPVLAHQGVVFFYLFLKLFCVACMRESSANVACVLSHNYACT